MRTSTTRKARARTTRSGGPDTRDTYDEYLRAGSAGAMALSRGLDQLGFWRALAEHPAYDAFWQDQAVDKLLANEPIKVPMMIVSGLFDQEDIYGGPALYQALRRQGPARADGASRDRARGITARAAAKAAASGRSCSKGTRPRGSAAP